MAIRSSAATTTEAMYVNGTPIDGKDQESVLDELIEQNWFFENLFNTTREKKVMLRSDSDPSCPSSKCPDGADPPKGLIRSPLSPPNVGGEGVKEKKGRKLTRQVSLQATTNQVKIKERDFQAKKGEARRSESTRQSSRHGLLRTPSLPPNIGRADVIEEEEEEDDESEYRMSNLIQQALTRRNTMKVMTQSGTNGANEMKNRFLTNQKKTTTKSLMELEIEEVQGFKKLVFNFDREDLTPGVVNLVPGLLENKKEHLQPNSNVRKPYLSEEWLGHSPAPPPIPNCVPRKSADVVKKQIKFWARAVASHASRVQFSF